MKNLLLIITLVAIVGCNNPQKEKEPKTDKSMNIKKEIFGEVEGKKVQLFTLTNNAGLTAKITNYGGIVTSFLVPDKDGNFDDVVLGYDGLKGYLNETPYFGAIVGRYANRIARGKFTLDENEFKLATNNGPNHLHGGIKGFDKVVWEAEEYINEDGVGIKLHYLSKDGEEGYPGNLNVDVSYTLTNKNELKIEYKATTDKPTPINLSHHSYFNLSGTSGRDILDQKLWIHADKYTVVDETLIPTGELRDVTGPMDFREPITVGNRIEKVEGGYDHNYVLNNNGNFGKVAELSDPKTGRVMEVYTSEPGMQFYSGNFLDGSINGKKGIVYTKYFGLCLETQHFPDSPNQPGFPNTILKSGEVFESITIYKFYLNP